jgi:hypothetical protein
MHTVKKNVKENRRTFFFPSERLLRKTKTPIKKNSCVRDGGKVIEIETKRETLVN